MKPFNRIIERWSQRRSMTITHSRRIAWMLMLLLCPASVMAADRTWDGGGGNNNWSTAANWAGDVAPTAGDNLIFDGTTRLTPNNDYAADTVFGTITFGAGAGAFTLSGNRITLTGDVTNSSSNTQTIAFNAILEWNPQPSTFAAWYDASVASTITASANAVSQWRDKSGGNFHMLQGTGANQPLTGSSTIGGLNAITFDGTNDSLQTATNPFGATINNAFVCMVIDIKTITNSTLFSLTGSSNNANRWQSHFPFGNNVVYFDCGGAAGGTRISYASGMVVDQKVIAGFYCSTADSVQQMWKDGTLQVGDATGHSVATVSGMVFGGESGNSDNVAIGEAVIINGTVTTSMRQTIEGYLAWKWGQTANLPAGHPYKNGSPGITFNAGANIVVSGILSGSGGVAKTGIGTLTLSNTNTYSGATTLTAGTVSVATIGDAGVAGNLGQASTAAVNILFNGGTLQYTGASASTDRNVTLTAATTGTIEVTTNTLTLSGATTATTGALTKVGTGTLVLAGANLHTGATTVSAGTLLVTGSTAAGSAISVASGATLGGSGTAAGSITLQAGATLAPGTGGMTINTLNTGAVTMNATSTYSVDLNGTSVTADRITATGAVACDGTLTIASLSGTSAFGNVYTIASGTSRSGTFTGLSDGATITAFSRTLRITYSSTAVTLTDITGQPATTKIWDGGGADNNWTTPANWVGDVAPAAGDDLVFAGGTRLTPNNDFAADTNFNSITFNAGSDAFVISGNRITLAGDITNNAGNLQTLNVAMVLAATRTVNAAAGNVLIGGILSGAGGLTKTGANQLILTAANTYTGATLISVGTLQLGNGGTTGQLSTSSSITNNGELRFNRTDAISQGTHFASVISGTGAVRQVGSGTGTVTLNGNNTFSGGVIINGAGIVTAASNNNALGSGTVTFTTNSVRLVVSDGLTIANNIIIGVSAGVTGRGLIENTGSGNAALSGGTITINNSPAAGGHFASFGTGSLTINHSITSSVGVGCRAGTVVIGGGGSYSNIWCGSGTIRLSATNGIATNATLDIGGSAAANFDLAGYNQSLDGVTKGAFAAVIGNSSTTSDSTLTLTGTPTYAGVIQDTLGSGTRKVALTVNSAGTVTLSGANTYTGATTVNAGTLLVTGSIAAGGSAVTVKNGATLCSNNTVGGSITLESGATIVPGASTGVSIGTLTTGNVTMVAGSTYAVDLNGTTPTFDRISSSGTVDCGSATLTIASVASMAVGKSFTIISAGTVTGTFNGMPDGSTFTQQGRTFRIIYTTTSVKLVDVGTGGLVWTGGGTDDNWSTGANWTGGVAPTTGDSLIFDGSTRLTPNNDIAAGTSFGSITFSNTAGNFTIGGNALTLTGGSTALVNLAASGTQTFNCALTFSTSAPTISTVSGGTLTVGGTIANGGLLLTVNAAGPVNLSGVISGSGGLTKTGSNTLTLSGASSYGGTTTLSAGTLTLSGGNDRLPTGTTLALTGGTTTFALGSNNQTISTLTTPDNSTTTSLTVTGSGSATLTMNGAVDFSWGSGGAVTGQNSTYTLNMSGLPNFVFNASSNLFMVGYKSGTSNTAGITADGTVTLATNNTITASALRVGTNSASNDGGTHTLHLGVANTIHVNAVTIALQRTNAYIDFNAASSSVTFRATDGTSAIPTATIGTVAANNNSAAWTAQVDLSDGTVDYLGTDMVIAIADPIGQTNRAGIMNSSWLMGNGQFTINGTLTVGKISTDTSGSSASGRTFAANGTFTLNHASGVATIATLQLAQNTIADGNATRLVSGTFNLTNGTLQATNVVLGAQTGVAGVTVTKTFNWTTGTIRNIAGTDLTWTDIPITLASGTHTFDIESGRTATLNSGSPIGGAFTLAKAGAGNLTLAGVNTYSGATTISAGNLDILGAGQLGSGTYSANISIASGSVFTYNSSANQILQTGVISGDGALVKSNTSALTLTGANTYTGGTTVNSGGYISISQSTGLGTGPLMLNGGGLKNADSDPIVSATTTLGVGGGYLSAGWSKTLTISGQITGTGNLNINTDSGVVILSSAANDYSGNTTIGTTGPGYWSGTSASTLLVNGSTHASSAVAVNSGGTLGGTGTVNGAITLASGGKVAPGAAGVSIGTLGTANVTFVSGSTYWVDLDGTGAGTSDRINAPSGTVNCGSATLTLASIANAADQKVYTIIQAASVTGTFNGLPDGASVEQLGRVFKIAYTPTAVVLTDLTDRIWDGGGSDDNWTTGANWVGDIAPVAGSALYFAGTVRPTPNNDFDADTRFTSITFNSGAGAFAISGNRITLAGNITNNDDSLQTINLDMIMAATWKPDQISTFAWYDATDTTSLWADTGGTIPASSTVARMSDKSGNGWYLEATGQPVIGTRTINGLNVLDFNGSQSLRMYYHNPLKLTDGNFSMYMVTAIDDADVDSDTIMGWHRETANWFQFEARDTIFTGGVRAAGISVGTTTFSGSSYEGSTDLWVGAFDMTNTKFTAYVNGTNKLTVNSYSGGGLRHWDMYTGYSGGNSPDGAVGEMLIVPDPSDAVRQKVEGYLAWKWGLQAKLPGGHPYVAQAPQRDAIVNAAAGNIIINGIMSGSGGITKTGIYELSLTGANTFTGATTISAGTLQLGNNGTTGSLSTSSAITNNATLVFKRSNTVVQGTDFNAVIAGSGAVIHAGSGTLTLNGANTYTGKTSTSAAGILQFGAYLPLAGVSGPFGAPTGANATIDLVNGSTLRSNTPGAPSDRINHITDRTINLISNGAGTVTMNMRNNDVGYTFGAVTATGTGAKTLALPIGGDRAWLVFSGVISDTADSALSLAVSFSPQATEAGTLHLSAVNTFTGTISITTTGGTAPGTVYIGSTTGATSGNPIVGTGQLGSGTYNNTIAVGSNSMLGYASTANQTLGGVISGAGGLTKLGSGTLTLSATNSYTGATTINAGAVLVNGSTAAGSAVAVNNSGTLGGNGTVNGPITMASGGIIAPGQATGVSIGTLNTAGVTFVGGSTYSVNLDGATPSAEQIKATGTVDCGSSTLSIASIANGSYGQVYTIINATTVSGIFNGLADGATVSQLGRTFTINYTTTQVTLTENTTYIWDGGGADNNWTTAANWVGDVVLVVGSPLQFAGSTRLTPFNDFSSGTTFASITFNAGGSAFVLGGNGITITGNITNNSTNVQTINNNLIMGATRTVSAASGDVAIGGIISGAGGLTKTGSNQLTLSAANTYSGTTTVNAGILRITNASALGSTAGGTIVNSGPDGVAAGGQLRVDSAGALNIAEPLSIYGAGNGGFNGALRVIQGDHVWSGAITLLNTTGGNRISVSDSDSVGTSSLTITGGIVGSAGTILTLGAGNAVSSIVVSSLPIALDANETVNVQGLGHVYLNVAGNSFKSLLIQYGITLHVGVDQPMPTTTDVTLGADSVTAESMTGTLVLNGNNLTINRLGSGTAAGVVLSGGTRLITNGAATAATLTVGNAGGTSFFDGVIEDGASGTTALTKTGAGTFTLAGANTYTGATTINGGTVLVTGSTHASSAVAINNGATLGGTGTVAGTVAVNAGGTLAPGTGGTTISTLTTGAVTYNATATYSVDLDGTGPTADRVTSTGAVACAGALSIASLVSSDIGDVYTIISAASVTGTFSGLADNTVFVHGGRTLRINYTGTTVTLTDVNVAPAITSRQTVDADGDGQIDRIRLTFDQNLNDDTSTLTVTVAGYVVTGFDSGTANDAVLDVLLTESGAGDTGATPLVQITANSSLRESAGTSLAQAEGSGTAASDGAAPVLLSSAWSDGGSGGVSAGDTVSLTFSESVTVTSLVAGDIGLPVSGDSLLSTTIADQSGSTISMTLAGTPQLTPGDTYSSAALTAGRPSGVYLPASALPKIRDVVTLSPALGDATSARDLTSTGNMIAIAWVTGSNPKAWTLGSVSLGATANTVTSGLDLMLRNVGDITADLSIAVADSTPSGWVPAVAAGSNAFLLKVDNAGLPAGVPTDPLAYELTLSNSDQPLTTNLFSGDETDFELYLHLPTAITTGAGIEQTTTVTITATLPP